MLKIFNYKCQWKKLHIPVIALSILMLMHNVSYAQQQYSGRIQYSVSAQQLQQNDLLVINGDRNLLDQSIDLRLMLDAEQDNFLWAMHYQLEAVNADSLAAIQNLPVASILQLPGELNDNQRLLDMSHTLHEQEQSRLLQRIDRLYIGRNGKQLSWKLGRYAVSWGNGMVYSVMDIFNPFDPAAIDKEFKTGDDMLYMQYLLSSGNDLQLLVIPRREAETGSIDDSVSSMALKYHGISGATDFDALIARHYNEDLLGVGFSHDIDGILWRADLMYSWADTGNYSTFLTSLSYAWSWGNKPLNGFVEYYAGFGEEYDIAYRLQDIADNKVLLNRLTRAEAYTIGRHYLAPGLDIEWHPLLHVQPLILYNLQDSSYLFQLSLRYEYYQNLLFTASLLLGRGRDGSEYGGIETPLLDTTTSLADTLTFQLNYYF